jgi:hypothetical protein
MVVAALLVHVLMRPDPLLFARELANVSEGGGGTTWGRTLTVFSDRPALLAAAAAQALAHAAMIADMIMTPLHMEHGGAGLELIGLVISVHVLGMFAPGS